MCDVKENEKPRFENSEKWRIFRNVFVVSIAFMLQFTAFEGTTNLQSSLNFDAGLGTSSLAATYAALMVSNVFLPSIILRWLGCKHTIAFSFILYMPYIAAQYWPTFYTLIPAAIAVGIGGGPMWVATCTYLAILSEALQKISRKPSEIVLMWFFGFFFMVFSLCGVWGNLISSLVLLSGNSTVSSTSAINASLIPEVCGFAFASYKDGATALHHQPSEKVYIIAGVYLLCMVAACVLICVGLDSHSRYDGVRKSSNSALSGWPLMVVTLKHLKDPKQLLLIPMITWLGLDIAFVGSDFTAAYVACAIGTGSIGYVMIVGGIGNSISSILLSTFVRLLGRLTVIIIVFLINVGIYITIMLWRPHPDEKMIFYIISGLWGITQGIWLVHLNSMCGILFPGREEASYSNLRLWKSLGLVIAYIYSPILRTYIKLYVLFALLILGTTCSIIIEIRLILKKKCDGENKENNDVKMGAVNDGFNKSD